MTQRNRQSSVSAVPIKHGGVLEAHLLTRYTLKEGVLYLDGEAINKTPEDFHLGA